MYSNSDVTVDTVEPSEKPHPLEQRTDYTVFLIMCTTTALGEENQT